MATERIIDTITPTTKSRLIDSINLGLAQFDGEVKQPSGMFGFNAVIETENTKITNDMLDFEYDIPFDDDLVPNEATITLYNLTDATASNFKEGNSLTVTAGYGTDTGVILNGKISKVQTLYDDYDKITTVYVLDDFDYTDTELVERTYEENTAASYILEDLLNKLGLAVEVFKVQRDHTYTSTTTVKGSIAENIKTYADVCGVSVWVSKQKVYCRPIWDGDNLWFTVSTETGMLGSPSPFEETSTSEEYEDSVTGYNISMLAQHRMTTAGIIQLKSKNYSGTFRICSGSHSYDGLSATTDIKVLENISTQIVETADTSTSSGSDVISRAVEWAIDIANDDTYGYDQSNRWGPDYDCSSFVISAYRQAGLSLSGAQSTHNMYSVFTADGFEDVTSSINLSTGGGLKKGDVLLNTEHHTSLVIEDGGKLANASINEFGGTTGGKTGDQTGTEICIRNYYVYSLGWNYVLRYKQITTASSSTSSWITGHTATTYGYNNDDNGICGWNGINYHNVSGCHVAIPTYCVKQASCYNSVWAKSDYPELADGYGTVLEVRGAGSSTSVIAVVADCGNFGKHNAYNKNAALDLPPNTYKALGLGTGTHDIEYRVIGSVKSWNGEQITESML